jgi:hypothetical protein
MQRLNLNKDDGPSGIGSRIENIYERIAGNDDYQRNDRSLTLIQFCVITVSAVATGCVNAFAHKNRIGWIGAGLLAVLIIGFVERFYFTLRHGLQTTYKSGMQRLAANLCYRVIQITMILNAAVLCVWIAGETMPPLLEKWNRWSITIHFMLALLGVTAVRDSDAVATHRRLELKAETARQDLVTLRKATMLGNPLVLFAVKLRGFLDGMRLARELLGDKSGCSPSERPGQTDGIDHSAGWSGLYLPAESRIDPTGNVAEISGKPRRR